MAFDLVILGSGGPIPDQHRAGPSYLVQIPGANLLFDCGRGALTRLAGAGVPSPAALQALFLTHLHSDHITDLNDVITTRWVTSLAPNPLTIVGPVGTKAVVERTITMLETDIGYRIAHHEDINDPPAPDVVEVEGGVAWEQDGVRVVAEPTDHRPVAPSLGYRVEFDGAACVLAGDTVRCDGLDRLVAAADVYVQTVVRRTLVEQVPLQRFRDILDYHSTSDDAGITAAKGGVGTLVLTHCVPTPAPGTEADWIADAAAAFAGTILLPSDLDRIAVIA